jgi:hypothetical protein
LDADPVVVHPKVLIVIYCFIAITKIIDDLGCRNSPNLTSIKIRNNATQLFGPGTYYNQCWDVVPNLNYICADSNEIAALQTFLSGCGVTQTITIDSACPLGVGDFEEVLYNLTPNPSHGIFQLNFANAVSENAVYTVYDMLGKKLLQGELIAGTTTAEIDISNYTQGVYVLNVASGNTMLCKKMVKR